MSASSDFVMLGPDAAVDVGVIDQDGKLLWMPFAVIHGGYRYRGDRVETTDAFSGTHKRFRVSNKMFEANIEAQIATDVPYLTTFNLAVRGLIAFRMWTYGRGDIDGLWQANRFIIEGDDGTFGVRGSPVQTVRIDGVSDGPITIPGGVLKS